jgi:hypothetical protein
MQSDGRKKHEKYSANMDNDQYPKGKGDKRGLISPNISVHLGIKISKQDHKPHKVFLNTLRYFITGNSDMLFQAS